MRRYRSSQLPVAAEGRILQEGYHTTFGAIMDQSKAIDGRGCLPAKQSFLVNSPQLRDLQRLLSLCGGGGPDQQVGARTGISFVAELAGVAIRQRAGNGQKIVEPR